MACAHVAQNASRPDIMDVAAKQKNRHKPRTARMQTHVKCIQMSHAHSMRRLPGTTIFPSEMEFEALH